MNKKFLAISIIAMLTAAAGNLLAADDRTYVGGRSASDDGGPPFSGAVMVDDILYVSGNLGIVDGKVPDDPADEARAVMDAIKTSVESAGLTMDDIFVVQIFCSDVSHYGVFNEVYKSYFSKEYPARAFIGSGPLLFGARFEVMVTAKKR